jgi:hypothetical protein
VTLDDLVALHLEHVRALTAAGGPLAPGAPTATVANPAWFVRGQVRRPLPARLALHRELVEAYRAAQPHVRAERKAIVRAGPPGAGKSRTLAKTLGAAATTYLQVDADELKRELLVRAAADGSYDLFLKPPAVAQLEADGDRWFPLEMSALVHEESSWLAKRTRDAAIEAGDNLVIALFEHADHDPGRPHIEYYRREGEVDCLVPISSSS